MRRAWRGRHPISPRDRHVARIGRRTARPALAEVLGSARAEIARLVPEVGDGSPGPPGPERDPSTLLELMVAVIGRLAAAAPLMIVFEDLHWADQPTIDLLALLVGTFVLGGGTHLADQLSQFTNDSYPSANNSWTANVFNGGTGTPTFTVYAICGPAAATG